LFSEYSLSNVFRAFVRVEIFETDFFSYLGKIEINDAEQIDQIDKAISKLTEEEKNELDKKKKFGK